VRTHSLTDSNPVPLGPMARAVTAYEIPLPAAPRVLNRAAASLGLPSASLGLPSASLGLPSASLGLPSASATHGASSESAPMHAPASEAPPPSPSPALTPPLPLRHSPQINAAIAEGRAWGVRTRLPTESSPCHHPL
jgi:hypothetical protein